MFPWIIAWAGLFAGLQTLRAEPPEVERPTVVLAQGEQRLVRVPDLARFSMGSGAARAVSLGKGRDSRILIKGVSRGETDLWAWRTDGSSEHRTVRVEAHNWSAQGSELRRLEQGLSRLASVEIVASGSGALLRGEIPDEAEAARVRALASAFPKWITDETWLGPGLAAETHRKAQAWADARPAAGRPRVELDEGRVQVIGSAATPAARRALLRGLVRAAPAADPDFDTLPDDSPTVHFKVFLLELRRDAFRSLGMDWGSRHDGAFRVTPWSIQPSIEVDVAVQALEGQGRARILSQPELSVRAPGDAELFAGGELPIVQHGRFGTKVDWRSFGLLLKLKVAQVAGDRVRLDIQTEVSSLDSSLAVESIPGFHANRMKTQVDARFATPLLLSGLLREGTQRQARGLPFLSRIPVLGALFGSEDFREERSELVAILLPRQSPPDSPLTRLSGTRRSFPLGPVPPARNWISPEEEAQLRASPEFPWNAL